MKVENVKDVTGYVLAGGQSSRMGIDKRWIKIGQETLIEHAYNLIESTLAEPPIVVSSNPDERIPSTWQIIPDIITGKGPLGGLVSALEHSSTDWILVLPVDLPFLTIEDLELLLAFDRNDCEVVTLSVSGEPEPLVALYSKSTQQFWAERLRDGKLALRSGIWKLKWHTVMIPTGSKALTNLNTQEDLARLK
ncbi:molybdenum cofactor guanylyltransferase [bacterium]|nr:molybdenum cofactor guanylyltransferase [bacterium]